MKKLERRAIICLVLAALLLLGTVFYCGRFLISGSSWVSFPANKHLYDQGVLTAGRVYDIDGYPLADSADGQRTFADSSTMRRATAHVVGDPEGRIGTGALSAFAGKLTGYNFVTGTHTLNKNGRDLYLTVDAGLNVIAYEALAGRNGTIGVYNYKTGEVLCLVSTPTIDPANPEEVEGAYINRMLSASFVPGSTFKLVTTAAAIDTLNMGNWSFQCTGSYKIGSDRITCTPAHGDVDFQKALAVSCNCGYANITLTLGGDTMEKYVSKLGLNKSISVNGINTAKGSFTFKGIDDVHLGWAGVGQYEDLVNPCAMMTMMGAIANGGVPVNPQLISKVKTAGNIPMSFYFKKKGGRMLSESTANELAAMMHNNVVTNYGEGNYPGLDLCAKSGTAEVGGDQSPHAWFTGFIRNEEHPYAFVVMIENSGSGSAVAGPVANRVLQAAVERR